MRRHKTFGKGRRRPGEMNGVEKRYADALRLRQLAGEVDWFAFEAVTLKLADDTRYTADFFVMLADGTLEVHECKAGFLKDGKVKSLVTDDAWVKVKVAAERFPFVFRMATERPKKAGGGFDVSEV